MYVISPPLGCLKILSQAPVVIPMDCSQAEGRINTKHSTQAASANALGAGAGRGGLASSQTEEIRKKRRRRRGSIIKYELLNNTVRYE